MNILRLAVRADQLFIPGEMRKHAQLNLGVIRVQKYTAFPRKECLPDQPPELDPHRDILQIRLRAAQPPCRCDRLVKRGMNPPVIRNTLRQTVGVGGFQLRQLTVFKYIRHNRIIRRQTLQNIRRRRVACFRLFAVRHFQPVKQNRPQLFRGINIELLSGLLINLLLQLRNAHCKPVSIFLQSGPRDKNSFVFHIRESEHQRHLNRRKQFLHPRGAKFF